MEIIFKNYLISDDSSRINREIVLAFLTTSYWAKRRAPERILKSIETSHCYGVYCDDDQVGFARVITDEATFYYICDVFVIEEYRGQGIGKKLIETIVNSERYEWMTRLLGTADAHDLYEQYGFEKDSERYMRRVPQKSIH